MIRPLLLCAFFLVLVHSRLYYLEDKHIIQMGEIYWNSLLFDFKDGLFIFYDHPESVLCKQLLPELQTAATDLFHIKSNVQFAKVDCHDEVKICELMGVNSYPTLMLHKGDKQYEYFGPRRSEPIKLWLQKIVDETFPICDHEENLFKRFNTAILLNKGSDVPNAIEAYKHVLDEVDIVQDHGDLFMKSLGAAGTIYSQGMEVIKFQDQDSASWISDKIENVLYSQKTAIPNFNARAWKKLGESEDADFILFFRTDGYSPLGEATLAFNKLARDNRGENIQFAYVNSDDIFGETLSKWFGVTPSGNSAVGGISKKKGVIRKYKLDTNSVLNEENIGRFIGDFRGERAPRYYMSVPTPPVEKQHLKQLIGSNYAQVTQDPKKSVFVLLYFPWNSAYLRLDNHFRVLHSRLWRNPDIVIAKLDLSENDAEGTELSESPALLLYPRGDNKKVIQYTSDVSITKLQDFLKENIPGLEADFDL